MSSTRNSITATGAIGSHHIYELLDRKKASEGYDIGTPIVKAGDGNGEAINIWSRCKPYRCDHPWDMTEEERKALNYGLQLYKEDTLIAYADANGAGLKNLPGHTRTDAPTELPKYVWRYDKPGPNDIHRITDWAGYCEVSAPPISSAGDFVLHNTDTLLKIHTGALGIQSIDNLRLSDFPYLREMYVCMLVYRRRKSTGAIETAGYVTASTSIGEGGGEISVKRNELQFANASLYDKPEYILCASSACKPNFQEQELVSTFYPLPCSEPPIGTIELSSASTYRLQVYAVGERNATSGYDISRLLPQPGTAEYFGIQNGFCIFCELTSNTGTATTLPLTSIHLSVMQTLSTKTMTVNRLKIVPSAMYTQAAKGGALTKCTSITIPSSGSIYVVFDLGNVAFMDDTGGFTDQPERRYGPFMATIGSVDSSTSDYTGAGIVNVNIFSGVGIEEFTGVGADMEI